jgi:beta-lactamase superfamily II metal-dependent hydrolase
VDFLGIIPYYSCVKKMLILFGIAFSLFGYGQEIGKPLPAWKEGMLDLHHINTGRGDAAFYLLPDGTTFLLDAGEMAPDNSPRRTRAQPNDSKPAHEWIAFYIRKFMPPVSGNKLDYALITHFHDDHFGGYYPGAPLSKTGKYFRSGITGVGDEIKITTMIDRGFPDYQYPFEMKMLRATKKDNNDEKGGVKGLINYWNFVDYQVKYSGMKAESLRAGRDDQIALIHNPKKFPSFKIRNVKSNGTIWTGKGTETIEHFTPYSDTVRLAENPLSNAIRIDYGDFRYYTGGDCPSIADLGQPPWNDVGTPVAKAVGEVDVAVMDHHGNRDSHNEFNVRTLRPRVWIQQTWSSDHPGHEVLRRVTSQYLYNGPRDLFATNMMEANKIVIGPALEKAYKSMDGHILLRVMPGGNEYYVIILNDENQECEVKAVFGPYQTKKKPKI